MNIVVDNYMMTEEEASKKGCPYILNKQGYPKKCNPECMSWITARKEISREDHSGAREVIQNEARERGYQKIKREGPHGCNGFLILEAQGFCLRLWKEKV